MKLENDVSSVSETEMATGKKENQSFLNRSRPATEEGKGQWPFAPCFSLFAF